MLRGDHMAGALLHNEEMCAEYLANGEKSREAIADMVFKFS